MCPGSNPGVRRRRRRRSPCRRTPPPGGSYSGINVLILWGSVIEHGFPVQGWVTFRQALSLGGNVRKGEHGTTVVYADRFVPDDEKKRAQETGEEAQAIPFLKRFTVFNLAQCEGLPEALAVAAPPPRARADRAHGRGADQSDGDRLPHRRWPRLLRARRGLCAGPTSAGLFRADQLAPHGVCTSSGTQAAIFRGSIAICPVRSARRSMPSKSSWPR